MDVVDVFNVREGGSAMNPYGCVLFITIGANTVVHCR